MDANVQRKRPRKRKKYRTTGISWRLFGTLALFVILCLLVIWVFQIVLLNIFYESAKLDECNLTNAEICAVIDDEVKIKEVAYTRSVETDTCITVYKIIDGIAHEAVRSDVNMGCTIHHLSADSLGRMYGLAAKKSDGIYTKKLHAPHNKNAVSSMVYVSIRENSEGVEYVIMMDSELIPLSTTVQTLQKQFGWIMCILIMGALIVALAISRIICAPMQKMSNSAMKLAKGDYSVEFAGGGYKEADELAEALNYAAEELAKNDDLQKELVANISHDLRTPLTMIKGYSEVMRDIPGENNPENVQVIIDETERLTELVNDMLDLSKIRSGTRRPELEEFNLTETVRAVIQRYEKLTERDNYSISFEADEDVYVTADRTMMLQVIYNLVNNAINYTGDDRRVSIVQSVWDNSVRISVIDTGDGISDEDLPYIWDRYYKVDKVHRIAKVGTGLGLSIVKGILEAHGFSYGVDSRVGEGSNFWFEMETFRAIDETEID